MPQFYFSQVAASTPYDNSVSGLDAVDVQAAIDEMKALIGSGTASLPLLQSQRTTNATFTTSWADVSINQTDHENAPEVISHDDVDRAVFRIFESGYYQLSYQFTAIETGGARLSSRLLRNNSQVLLGSDRFMEVGTDVLNSISVNWMEAGDYFKLQILRSGGTTGVAYANIVVYAIKLGGAKGEKGDTGSGSSVSLENNNTPVTGTPHSIINFDSNFSVTDNGGGQATVSPVSVFGTNASDAANVNFASTTSTSYQERLSLVTGVIPAGKYRIGWMYEWGMTNTSYSFDGRVQVDDVTTLMNHVEEPQDGATTQRHQVCGFAYITLTNGSHYIDLDYRSSSVLGTARIQGARLEIWRVS